MYTVDAQATMIFIWLPAYRAVDGYQWVYGLPTTVWILQYAPMSWTKLRIWYELLGLELVNWNSAFEEHHKSKSTWPYELLWSCFTFSMGRQRGIQRIHCTRLINTSITAEQVTANVWKLLLRLGDCVLYVCVWGRGAPGQKTCT